MAIAPVKGGSNVSPDFGIEHKIICTCPSPTGIKFRMRHQGNTILKDCGPHEDPPPKRAVGRSTSKSAIFFKNLLVRNYRAKCA